MTGIQKSDAINIRFFVDDIINVTKLTDHPQWSNYQSSGESDLFIFAQDYLTTHELLDYTAIDELFESDNISPVKLNMEHEFYVIICYQLVRSDKKRQVVIVILKTDYK